MKQTLYILIISLFFIGCAPKINFELLTLSSGSYAKSSFTDLPSWDREKHEEALAIFKQTCASKKAKELLEGVCKRVKRVPADDAQKAKKFFEENFTPFVSLSKESLATGYYEPLLHGSLKQTPIYKYPVYTPPSDLVRIELTDEYKQHLRWPLRGQLVDGTVKPYFTREEIKANGLENEKPICYVDDKINLFFLHVQGSGRVKLENNNTIYVGYADQNGHPYVSIGKEMISRGLIKEEDISLESICEYLQMHPEQVDPILDLNPSFIFFEKRHQAATGSFGLELEPQRSIAVDKHVIPLGLPVYISTHEPLSMQNYQRMMFAHDTGGAINGESRIDIFFGSGNRARKQASVMQDEVKLWMLVPNDYANKSK